LSLPISISALTRAFECDRNRVAQALAHGREPPEARGRHMARDAEIEGELLFWIETNGAKSTAVTVIDIRAQIGSHDNLPVSRAWVNAFVGRHLERLWKAKSITQGAQRLEIPRCFLGETIQCIAQFVQARPAELVFNLDEVGISELEDRRTRKLIVPVSALDRAIHQKIHRALKHLSDIACVSAAGESLTPYILTSQDSAKLREQLNKRGVRFERITF
jgi:hypothetical protein